MFYEFSKIEKELKRRARKKDIEAIVELAELSGGVGTKPGLRYYTKAACLGDRSACREINIFFYTKGIDIAKSSHLYNNKTVREIRACFKVARKWAVRLYKFGEGEYADMIEEMKLIISEIKQKRNL